MPASEKQRAQLSKRRKEFVASEETRAKCSIAGAKANKNKRLMNDGIHKAKYIDNSEVDKYLEQG